MPESPDPQEGSLLSDALRESIIDEWVADHDESETFSIDSTGELDRYVRAALKHCIGAELIALERLRQVVDEGYTPDHDAQHGAEPLLRAAAAYLDRDPDRWPWNPQSFKISHDRHRDLVKAGALIAAALDCSTGRDL